MSISLEQMAIRLASRHTTEAENPLYRKQVKLLLRQLEEQERERRLQHEKVRELLRRET